jgi:hypothetical protein
MKARQLIGGAAFPPDVLKVIFEAFDDAWLEVAGDVSTRAAFAVLQKCIRPLIGARCSVVHRVGLFATRGLLEPQRSLSKARDARPSAR